MKEISRAKGIEEVSRAEGIERPMRNLTCHNVQVCIRRTMGDLGPIALNKRGASNGRKMEQDINMGTNNWERKSEERN